MQQTQKTDQKWQIYLMMPLYLSDNTGEELSKDEFLDYMLTGIRDKTTCENRRLIYENDEIIVSHSILDGPAGRNAVMLVRSIKDGKIVRAETGSTPISV